MSKKKATLIASVVLITLLVVSGILAFLQSQRKPKLQTKTPEDQETGITLNSTFSFYFDTGLSDSSLRDISISPSVPFEASLRAWKGLFPRPTEVIITPRESLSPGTTYTINIPTPRAWLGKVGTPAVLTIKTVTGVRVLSSNPSDNTENVGRDLSSVVIIFDKEISTNGYGVSVSPSPVFTKTLSEGGTKLVLDLSPPLAAEIRYTVSLAPGPETDISKRLSGPYSFSFTTQPKTEEEIETNQEQPSQEGDEAYRQYMEEMIASDPRLKAINAIDDLQLTDGFADLPYKIDHILQSDHFVVFIKDPPLEENKQKAIDWFTSLGFDVTQKDVSISYIPLY